MATISWDETLPSDSENAGLGDDRIRSLKTSIRVGLDAEHVWPAFGGDAGIHRLGSGRPFYGAQSLVSSTGTDGRLMIASDTSRVFHVGSAGTMFLGGANVPSMGSAPTGGQRFYWALECGVTDLAAGQTLVTFPNSGFSGIPFVYLSVATESGAVSPPVGKIRNLTAASFTALVSIAATGATVVNSATTLHWFSIGTRTF